MCVSLLPFGGLFTTRFPQCAAPHALTLSICLAHIALCPFNLSRLLLWVCHFFCVCVFLCACVRVLVFPGTTYNPEQGAVEGLPASGLDACLSSIAEVRACVDACSNLIRRPSQHYHSSPPTHTLTCYTCRASLHPKNQVCAACNESKLDCSGGVFRAVGAPTEASLKVTINP